MKRIAAGSRGLWALCPCLLALGLGYGCASVGTEL